MHVQCIKHTFNTFLYSMHIYRTKYVIFSIYLYIRIFCKQEINKRKIYILYILALSYLFLIAHFSLTILKVKMRFKKVSLVVRIRAPSMQKCEVSVSFCLISQKLDERKKERFKRSPRGDRCGRTIRILQQIAFYRFFRVHSFNYPFKQHVPGSDRFIEIELAENSSRTDCTERRETFIIHIYRVFFFFFFFIIALYQEVMENQDLKEKWLRLWLLRKCVKEI